MPRPECARCRRPPTTCYCHLVRPFVARADLLVLRHPREVRSRLRVNTAGLVPLCVRNARLKDGLDFWRDPEVQSFLPGAWLVYPGPQALDLASLETPPRRLIFLDGSWRGAGHMLRHNEQLAALPRATFHAPASRYVIRRQPRSEFTCTAEAVYWCLEALGQGGEHRNLLEVLDFLVDCQRPAG